MPLISIDGGSLFAERFGTGSPRVLALHGWSRRGADFTAALEGLDGMALDLPGFGASPPPPAVMGAAGYADLIAPAFALFDTAPVVVGHSFGGRVAVARQSAHPGSARGLVLAASPLVRRSSRRGPSAAHRLARLGHKLGLLSDARMERWRRRHGSADYRAASGVMRDVLVTAVNESYEAELTRLGVPVHLLWGNEDMEVPVTVAKAAEEIIRSAGTPVQLEVLEGVGHHVPLQAPAALRRAIEDVMARSAG